jgi:transporter family protein
MALLLLVVSTILWGVWGYINKLAVEHAHPLTVQWMYYLPSLLLIPVLFLLAVRAAPETNLNGSALRLAAVSSLAAAGASLLFFYALQDMNASVAVAVTAAYPVITLTLGVVFGQETLSLQKIVGIGVIILGIVILQWEA